MRLLSSVVVLAALTALAAPAEAQTCDRLPRDCDAEARAFEARARRLQNLSDPVKAGVDALKLRRRAACLEWNACALEDATLQRMTAWADDELQQLARAADEEARSTWARGLTQRGQVAMAQGTAAANPASFRPQLTPQVVESILRLKEEVESLEAFRPIVIRIQRGSVIRNRRKPPICESNTREELRTLVRSGAQLVQGYARSLASDLTELCEPFETWESPPENIQLMFTEFNSRLERIDGWLTEIIACVQPGPYSASCRNAYGSKTPQTLPDARRAMGELNRVRAVMRRSRSRFPCHDAIWARLATTQWTLRTAQAQIPALSNQVHRICDRIGLTDEDLEKAQNDIRDETERLVASIAQYLTSRRQALSQLRTVYGDQLPPNLR
ncbi:MAG: hypothetical protein JJ863_30270 [Deltaproteobacteria bacterium]|nr:hypothetical protein [Deltaproteobacteria bacterium]